MPSPKTKAPAATSASATDKQVQVNSSGNKPTTGTKDKKGTHAHGHNTSGVLDYLHSVLSRKRLLSLYMEESRGQYVCRAVLQQAIPIVSQQIVIRLACTGGTFPLSGIQLWMSVDTIALQALLKELHKWAIIQDYNTTNTTEISLTIPFYKGLQTCLCSLDSSPWIPLTQSEIDAIILKGQQEAASKDEKSVGKVVLPSRDDLERYIQLQWDAVLHFLVGTVGTKEPPPAVVHFLLQTGLMQPDPDYVNRSNKKGVAPNKADLDNAPLVITTKGYDFMLQDNYQQVWHFVVQYLHSIEQHPKGEELLKEALLLLICLSFTKVGAPYLTSNLKKDCRTMIKDLALFGLLFTMKIANKVTIFYPTKLAIQMVGNTSSTTSSEASSALWSLSSGTLEASLKHPNPVGSSHLAIIVQTNFQLAAYTTSELHISMLGLFCDVSSIRRLPNVVMMQITRDSIKSAFSLGIKARQILRFLEKHTHPKLRQQGVGNAILLDSPVPANVVDQIWLWDRELSRVTFTKVYQHNCLMGVEEYKAVQQYAIERGAHAWSSDRRQHLLLDYKHVDRIQAFVRQWRAQTVSRQNND